MNLTKKDLISALDEALNKHPIDDSLHKTHHDFIQMEIERRQNNKKLWMKFKLSVVGTIATGVIAGLVWIGTLVVDTFNPNG